MALLPTLNNVHLAGHMPPVSDTGQGIPVFEVTTNDNEAAIEGLGYFNAIVARAPVGSIIKVLADLDGTPRYLHYVVTANNGTSVTVTQQTHAST